MAPHAARDEALARDIAAPQAAGRARKQLTLQGVRLVLAGALCLDSTEGSDALGVSRAGAPSIPFPPPIPATVHHSAYCAILYILTLRRGGGPLLRLIASSPPLVYPTPACKPST